MLSIKKFMIVSAAAAAMAGSAAGVANAQPGRYYDRGDYNHRYEERYDRRVDRGDRLSTSYVDGLQWRIDNAARMGRISWREANLMKGDLNAVKPIAWRYQTGQARQWEVNRLQRTVDRIDSEIRG
jgi:hypothetical protein